MLVGARANEEWHARRPRHFAPPWRRADARPPSPILPRGRSSGASRRIAAGMSAKSASTSATPIARQHLRRDPLASMADSAWAHPVALEKGAIGGFVQQRVELGGVLDEQLQEPALAERVFVDRIRRRSASASLTAEDLAGNRRIDLTRRLDALDRRQLLAFRDALARLQGARRRRRRRAATVRNR